MLLCRDTGASSDNLQRLETALSSLQQHWHVKLQVRAWDGVASVKVGLQCVCEWVCKGTGTHFASACLGVTHRSQAHAC